MAIHHKQIGGSLISSGHLSMNVRSSLTGQFLMAAAMQAHAAERIESRDITQINEEDKIVHRGFVVGAIMQATAALEGEIWEVMTYGPGHHLGSNGIDLEAKKFLAPLTSLIDGENILERYREGVPKIRTV
jgi:hypothetical protein